MAVTYDLGWLGPLVTVAWILGLTNAFNLVDGLDGLASGLVAIAAVTCAIALIVRGQDGRSTYAGGAGGCDEGFLVYNLHPARIFLGDSGSLLAGFLLAVTAITGQQKGATTLAAGVPLLIFALPILETVTTAVRRLVVGQRDAGPGLLDARARWRRSSRPTAAISTIDSPSRRCPPRVTVLVLYAMACGFSAIALLTMEVP